MKVGRIILYILAFLFILPNNSFAFTWQDVENSYNSAKTQYPKDLIWVEEVTTSSGSGYRIYRRQDAISVQSSQKVYLEGPIYTPSPGETGAYYFCDGRGEVSHTNYSDASPWGGGYIANASKRYNYYCDGHSVLQESWGSYPFGIVSSPCLWRVSSVADCKSFDVLYAEFIPVTQCLNKLTNTYESCLQNCKDPVEKTNATETCGDGIDNNCNGEIDEGCCEVNIKVSPSEVYPQKTGGNTEANIIASWNKPAPPEGCNVKFKVEPVEKSGGHNHDGKRPKGSVSPDTLTISGGSIGIASGTHKYTSSEVSGEEKIIAEVDDEKKDEAMVRVMVPGLMLLESSIVYNRTGSTSSHPSNHYGASFANNAVANISFDYLYETDTILGINDMSLAWGGLFDKDGGWKPPHKWHRVGKSADIDRNVYDVNEGKYILIPCEDDKKLFDVVVGRGKLICESGGRKHIEFP